MDKQDKALANELLGKLTHKCARFFPHLALLCYLLGGVWIVLCVELFDSESLMILFQVPMWVSIILLFFWLARYRPIKKRIIHLLQADGIKSLERFVDERKSSINQKTPFLGNNYFFYPKRAFLLRYNEIVWLYNKQVTTRMSGVAVRTDTHLMLATSFGKVKPVCMTKKQAAFISTKNPGLMVGYTEENIRAYQNIVKRRE